MQAINRPLSEFHIGQRVTLVDWTMPSRFGAKIPVGAFGTVKEIIPVEISGYIDGKRVKMQTCAVIVTWDGLPIWDVVMGAYEIAPADAGSAA